ncbi:CRISPR type I-e/-associated protein casb/cse2 [Propionibacterium sp. oral taxon 192 str. F0372]|uniref:type I-E CRISPR-associated protein Cse2/CasB n=1 Tax=Propionibacterium sp. oral taxon 192 TaxID=671222 RepID=UPI0003547F20|nr:type I-E CRISPR-associated protein Cse2/CasB [Propionibacterium sp. oral taxon 192]EPH04078.1 CRISPR type I-e/-associated protein casb/cse2 [Propionibacterium sp. oral taxon 192 str. F0372]
MTTKQYTISPDGSSTAPHPKASQKPVLHDAGLLVHKRISGLQNRVIGGDPRARGALANLRRAASKEPGEIAEIWELTQVDVPDHAGDAPTREEIAVHTAITLYALHQQSRSQPMYCQGIGLGRAARRLVGPDDGNSSLRARFNALVTSSTVTELRHHLRTFIPLLRTNEIPMDHAMLADDIVQFQRPGQAKTVLLRWARQYYSVPQEPESTSSPESA